MTIERESGRELDIQVALAHGWKWFQEPDRYGEIRRFLADPKDEWAIGDDTVPADMATPRRTSPLYHYDVPHYSTDIRTAMPLFLENGDWLIAHTTYGDLAVYANWRDFEDEIPLAVAKTVEHAISLAYLKARTAPPQDDDERSVR